MKLTLNSILSGFLSVAKMSQNFTDIENEFQDKVLYRNNPTGEPNQMENTLDMNSNRIINLTGPVNDSEPARWVDVKNGVSTVDEPIPSQTGNAGKALITNGSSLVFDEAENLDYNQSGTGAVVRTIQSRFREVVYASDFGADPSATAAVNAAAIQAAIDALPQSTSGQNPARYISGGGVVILGRGIYEINTAVKVTHHVTLSGQGIEATVLKTTGNTDAIQIDYKNTGLAEYTTIGVKINDLTLDLDGVGEAGITNRVGTSSQTSRPISYCSFENVEVIGAKVGFHIFGGWNNIFKNLRVAAKKFDDDNAEGMYGFIGETVTAGNTYGPSGHAVTAEGAAGGFNNNDFINCVFIYLKRVGIHIRAISLAHAYSNYFTGCNMEQIVKRTTTPIYAPYTTLTATPEGGSPETLAWDGRAVGFNFLGRIAGFKVDNCYIERISDQGIDDGGEGLVHDDLNIKFGAGASKDYQNVFSNNFINANVERIAHYDRSQDCVNRNNAILLSTGTDKGYLVTANASGIRFEGESIANINSASANNYDWINSAEGIGLNGAIHAGAQVTINSGAGTAIDLYRDGAAANFDLIRIRDGTNGNTLAKIGYSSGQLRIDATTSVSIFENGNEKMRLDGSVTAGETAMFLYNQNSATLERVTVGAADSGGVGKRALVFNN